MVFAHSEQAAVADDDVADLAALLVDHHLADGAEFRAVTSEQGSAFDAVGRNQALVLAVLAVAALGRVVPGLNTVGGRCGGGSDNGNLLFSN